MDSKGWMGLGWLSRGGVRHLALLIITMVKKKIQTAKQIYQLMFCLNANVDFSKSVVAVESGSNSNSIMEMAKKSIHPVSTIYCPKQRVPLCINLFCI